MQRRQLRAQNPQPIRSDPVRLPSILRRQRLNPALLLQPRNRPIQRSRPQPRPAHALNVFDHRVPMLRPISQASQHQQRRIGIVPHSRVVLGFYYVSRTTHNVVIARSVPARKRIFCKLSSKCGNANVLGNYPLSSSNGFSEENSFPSLPEGRILLEIPHHFFRVLNSFGRNYSNEPFL
jgi:hypothetical protein